MENVIAVVFKNESDGCQMITELRNAPKAEQAAILQREMERQARYQLRQTRKADMKAALKAKRQEREAELEKNFEEYKANLNL